MAAESSCKCSVASPTLFRRSITSRGLCQSGYRQSLGLATAEKVLRNKSVGRQALPIGELALQWVFLADLGFKHHLLSCNLCQGPFHSVPDAPLYASVDPP